MAERDAVDEFLDTALRYFPEVDAEVEGIVDRIGKLSKSFQRLWDLTAERHGVSQGGGYKVLLKLRQSPGGRATPSELAEWLSLSTGAMTNRLDRLEQTGLIVREPDANDRRSSLVRMTDAGRGAFDEAVAMESKEEARIIGVLTPEEQHILNGLLRRLVLAFDGDR